MEKYLEVKSAAPKFEKREVVLPIYFTANRRPPGFSSSRPNQQRKSGGRS
jgi:hypothetical protein